MMYENCAQLEAQANELERSKATLTGFIHTQLKQVAKLQERVAHSNSQLLLLHEHIKLAKKRFEVLRQVCHTPQVLAHVLSEVDRRMAFNSTLEKVSYFFLLPINKSCDIPSLESGRSKLMSETSQGGGETTEKSICIKLWTTFHFNTVS